MMHGADACGAGEIPPACAIDIGERLGPCPSCHAEIAAGLVDNPLDPAKKMRALFHSIPFCTYFGQTDTEQIAADIATNAKAAGAEGATS